MSEEDADAKANANANANADANAHANANAMTPAPARRSILRTTLIVLPAQVIFRGVEAALPLLLIYWYGRSVATDVYNLVLAVFGFAGSLVFSAYQDSALVPILAEERIARPKELPRLLGSLLAHTWAIGGAVAFVVGLGSFAAFAILFHESAFSLAAKMVVPFTFFLVAVSTRTFFSTLLAARHQFFVQPIASCIGMLSNFAVLAIGHERLGVALIPAAALVGEVVAGGVLAFTAIRYLHEKISLNFSRPDALIRFAKLVSSEIMGGAVTRVNPVVDQFMAGLSAIIGAGTMMRYSGDVATLPTSLLQAALLPVLLSHLSDDFAARDISKVRNTVAKALGAVMGLLVLASLLLFFVRDPLLRFIFLRGKMDEAGIALMIRIFPYHLVGLAPFGALLVLARAHVAVKNSTIMLSMGIINASCNVVFNIVLLKAIGVEGIALSTSCVQAAVAIVFWFRFESRLTVLARERGLPA